MRVHSSWGGVRFRVTTAPISGVEIGGGRGARNVGGCRMGTRVQVDVTNGTRVAVHGR